MIWLEATPRPICVSGQAGDHRTALQAFRELVTTAQEGLWKGDPLVANLVEQQTPIAMARLDDTVEALRESAASCVNG